MAFPTIPTTGAGRVLTAVQANTTATRTFPSLTGLTKNSGDLLVAICIAYQCGTGTDAAFSSWGGGFTEVGDSATTTTMAIGVATKVSDGTETGTFTVTQASVTGQACFILMSIPGGASAEVGGRNSSTNATQANPSSFSPSWGSADTLWIAVGGDGEDATAGSYTGVTASPTNYSGDVVTAISQDAIGGVNGLVGFRQNAAASEDAGAFTADTSNARHAGLIIAIRPKQDATASPSAIARSFTLPAVTASPQNATASPNVIARSFTLPAVTVEGGFPLIRSSMTTGGTDLSAGVSPALPAGAAAGDLVLYFVGHDDENVPTLVGSGWTVVDTEVYLTSSSGAVFARVLDGTTGDNLISIDGVTANDYTIHGIAITEHGYTTGDDLTTIPVTSASDRFATQNTYTADPPSLTPSTGSRTYLWLAFGSVQKRNSGDDFDLITTPTDFTTVATVDSAASATGVHSALYYRKVAASTLDPSGVSGFSLAEATRTTVAFTVAITPPVPAVVTPDAVVSTAATYAPTLAADSAITPDAIQTVAASPAAASSAGSAVNPAAINTPANVIAPIGSASGTRTPSAINRAFTLPLSVGTGSPYPRFIGAGTPNSSTGDLGIPLPSNIVTGDLLTLHIESYNTGVSLQPGPEWIPIDGADGLSSAINVAENSVFYTFYDENDPPSTVIPDSGDHTACVVLAWRDVNPTNPIHVYLESTDATSGSTQTATGVTTTVPNAMIVASWSVSTQTSTANITGGTPANYSEAADYAHTLGNDGTLIVGYGVRSAAGATGNITALTNIAASAAWVFALAPAGGESATATPDAIIRSFTLPAVDKAAGATVEPALIARLFTIGSPTVVTSTDDTAEPDTIVVAAVVNAPTPSAGATSSPGVIARLFNLFTPTVSGGTGATATPSAVERSFTLPPSTASAGSTASPTVIARTFTIGAPIVTAGSTVTPSVVLTTVTTYAPSLSAGMTFTTTTIETVATPLTPTTQAASTSQPSVIVTLTSTGAPAVSAGSSLVTGTIAGLFATHAPTVNVGGTATPVVAVAVVNLGAPDVTAGASVAPADAALSVTLFAPSLSAGAATIPATVVTIVSMPIVSASGNEAGEASPAAIARSFVLNAPTLSAAAQTSPNVVVTIATVGVPSLSAGASLSPSAVPGTFVLNAPVATGGTGATTTPETAVSIITLPATTLSAGSTVTSTVITRPFTLPPVILAAGGSTTPASVATLAALYNVTLTSGHSIVLGTIPSVVVTGTPQVSAGSTGLPDVINLLTASATPMASAGSTVATDSISRTFVLNAPTVPGGSTITPALVVVPVTLQAPALSAGSTIMSSTIPLDAIPHNVSASGGATTTTSTVPVPVSIVSPTLAAGSSTTLNNIDLSALLADPMVSASASTLSSVIGAVVDVGEVALSAGYSTVPDVIVTILTPQPVSATGGSSGDVLVDVIPLSAIVHNALSSAGATVAVESITVVVTIPSVVSSGGASDVATPNTVTVSSTLFNVMISAGGTRGPPSITTYVTVYKPVVTPPSGEVIVVGPLVIVPVSYARIILPIGSGRSITADVSTRTINPINQEKRVTYVESEDRTLVALW